MLKLHGSCLRPAAACREPLTQMSLCLQDHDRAEKRRKDEEVHVTARQVTRLPTSHRMASWCGTCTVLLCARTSSVWLHLTCTSLLACLSSVKQTPTSLHKLSACHRNEQPSYGCVL